MSYVLGLAKQYHQFYKKRLATLLGKNNLGNTSSFIFMVLILLFTLLILLLLLTVSISLYMILYNAFYDPIFCMDSLDAYNELLAKITEKEGNIEYFLEQAKETDRLFKEALRDNLPEEMRQERLEAKKDSEINLNIERKILRVLKNRLDSGNFNSSLSTPSSLGKRNFDE